MSKFKSLQAKFPAHRNREIVSLSSEADCVIREFFIVCKTFSIGERELPFV